MHKLSVSYRSIDKSLKAQTSRSFQGTQLLEHIELRIGFACREMRRLHRRTRLSEKLLARHGASLSLTTACEETLFFRGLLLTLYCPVFTLYIIMFNVQKFYPLLFLCVFFCGSQRANSEPSLCGLGRLIFATTMANARCSVNLNI